MSRVLITGCSTGIGRATAIELNRRGHAVVATARRPEALSNLDVTDRLQLDVDDPDSIRAAVEAAGEVDVLVNNAAWGAIGPIETIPLDEVRAMYETNVFGALRMLQAVLPGAETLRYEVRPFGIRVVAVEPGWTATAWSGNEQWLGIEDPPYDALYRHMKALDEAGLEDADSPEDVAAVIVQAIEADDPPLRVQVGEEVTEVVAERRAMSEREREELNLERQPFDW